MRTPIVGQHLSKCKRVCTSLAEGKINELTKLKAPGGMYSCSDCGVPTSLCFLGTLSMGVALGMSPVTLLGLVAEAGTATGQEATRGKVGLFGFLEH